MAPIFVSPWLLQNMSAVPSFFMTEVNDQLNYDQAVAYLSVRILIIGGVILFFLGLCCIAAVLLRFNRQQHLEVQRIEFIKGWIPLSTMATDSMPVSPIPIPTQNSLGRENYAESTYEEACCSICLCEYITDDRVRVLPCTHEYHAECIDIWLANKSTQCPLCKHDLLDDLEFSSRLHSS
ncbi:hypothetical protein BGX29_000452 [Mortierella sp. GBA35]|nr:hypothetical protein BGX29_000452 [Mortierella sp. GBA35]